MNLKQSDIDKSSTEADIRHLRLASSGAPMTWAGC